MKPPLTRPGHLQDTYAALDAQRQDLERMINLANNLPDTHPTQKLTARSAAGDEQRLRAIPVAAPGVPGVIPGTQPEQQATRHT